MDPLQSKINATEARILQIKNSELFSEADRKKRLPELEAELEKLFMEKADQVLDIEVKDWKYPEPNFEAEAWNKLAEEFGNVGKSISKNK